MAIFPHPAQVHALLSDPHATEVLFEANISLALSDVSVQFVNHLQLKLAIAAHKNMGSKKRLP